MMERHELSALCDNMTDLEYADLLASVKADGFVDYVIKTYEGKVLDGWHRYRAANDADMVHTLLIDEFTGLDPREYVRQKNLYRRNYTASQRTAIAVALNEWTPAGNPNLDTERLKEVGHRASRRGAIK